MLNTLQINNAFYPKISIVTSSFNQAQFIEETIKSVLSQGYPNLEYIIIDGGSTDGSVDIIKKYADKLSYWVSESDNGRGDAVNKGFKHCTGEIMGWINPGNEYFPWTFSILSSIFADLPEVEWLASETNILLNDEGVVSGRIIFVNFGRWGFKDGLYLPCVCNDIPQESTFWRRSLWVKTGAYLDKKLSFAIDFELWQRFFKHSKLYTVGTALAAKRLQKAAMLYQTSNNYSMEAYKVWRSARGHFPVFLISFLKCLFLKIPLLGYALWIRAIRYDHVLEKWYSTRLHFKSIFKYYMIILRRVIKIIK